MTDDPEGPAPFDFPVIRSIHSSFLRWAVQDLRNV
jgi:hypothetical protein